MAYDRQHLHLTAIGYLGPVNSGSDKYAWGIKISGAPDYDAVAALAELDIDAMAARFGVYHANADTKIHTNAKMTSLKATAIGVDGHYLTDAREAEPAPGGVAGGSSGTRPANQVALVISLGSNTQIGRATKGRFYLPLTTITLNTNGASDSSITTPLLASTVDFLQDVIDICVAMDEVGTLQLMSNVGAGISRAVSRVRVGQVPDTMRSRRNALSEGYVEGTVNPVGA
jgi:hypothetical protein